MWSWLHAFLDPTRHWEYRIEKLFWFWFVFFGYFRLYTCGCCPWVFTISSHRQLRSINPHSQNCTMTDICRNQLLNKRRNSRSQATDNKRLTATSTPAPCSILLYLFSSLHNDPCEDDSFPIPFKRICWKELSLSEVTFIKILHHSTVSLFSSLLTSGYSLTVLGGPLV